MNRLLTLFYPTKLFEYRSVVTRITAEGKDVAKKPNTENRITLIGTDDSVSITDLRNAQNLSSRRDLKLVKIQDVDSKTRRPVYKLMTSAQYHEEELSRRKEKTASAQNNIIKGQKLMTLSTRIAEHDLLTNVKKMARLLEKQYEVRIIVSGDENDHIKLLTSTNNLYGNIIIPSLGSTELSCLTVVKDTFKLACPGDDPVTPSSQRQWDNFLCTKLFNNLIETALSDIGLVHSDGNRPNGMTLDPWSLERSLVRDATYVDKLAASHIQERISTVIEKNLKTVGRIVQMRTKGNNLRFNLIPNRSNSDQAPSSDSSESDKDRGPL